MLLLSSERELLTVMLNGSYFRRSTVLSIPRILPTIASASAFATPRSLLIPSTRVVIGLTTPPVPLRLVSISWRFSEFDTVSVPPIT